MQSPTVSTLNQQLDGVLRSLDPAVRATAQQIPDTGRRLLAVRGYLRAGNTLPDRWSWTATEAAAFMQSAEGRGLQRAVAAVQCTFAAANAGHVLHVNPEFRTLEIQTRRWNDNPSVGRAAARLLRMAEQEAARRPQVASTSWLSQWLVNQAPQPVPTLAVPGLSPHGRGSAIDFQVHRQGKVVAGPDSTRIDSTWEAGGWNARLADAVAASGAPFEGPLQSPREPWHYRYVPTSAQAVKLASCADAVPARKLRGAIGAPAAWAGTNLARPLLPSE